ncbi:hypothetical protein [Borrelia sp. RT5S]|uniref:hypothetical protein n=1 Tax=Borrelia sp. RT5S TaxID=2898581 RepID=UPI001E5E6DB9|nr:hypothetical protein [Borrelia sp. RT5S]UGQ16636.1 hypothetical protein LSO06_04795 [Borrelia sp. RT5S]
MLYLLNEYRMQKQTGSVTVISIVQSRVVGVMFVVAFITQMIIIESIEVKNLALYHDHKTKKLEYEKFIDKKNDENKKLEVQIKTYLAKVKELDIKHHETIKESSEVNNMYGIHALGCYCTC